MRTPRQPWTRRHPTSGAPRGEALATPCRGGRPRRGPPIRVPASGAPRRAVDGSPAATPTGATRPPVAAGHGLVGRTPTRGSTAALERCRRRGPPVLLPRGPRRVPGPGRPRCVSLRPCKGPRHRLLCTTPGRLQSSHSRMPGGRIGCTAESVVGLLFLDIPWTIAAATCHGTHTHLTYRPCFNTHTMHGGAGKIWPERNTRSANYVFYGRCAKRNGGISSSLASDRHLERCCPSPTPMPSFWGGTCSFQQSQKRKRLGHVIACQRWTS